jgi:hypothetical protein
MNPFYEQTNQLLPSAVLAAVKKEYLDHDNHQLALLRHITLDFSEDTNSLSIFYSKELTTRDVDPEMDHLHCTVNDLVINYIEEKKLAKKKGRFISNIVSNIFAEFADGYLVKSLNFADVEVEFVVRGDRFLLSQLRNNLEGMQAYPFGEMLKIVTYGASEEASVRNLLDEYGLLYDAEKRTKKEETLNARIYMRFYTGRLKGDPLLLYYGTPVKQ